VAITVTVAVLTVAAVVVTASGSRRDVALEKLFLEPAVLWADPNQDARWKDFARRVGGKEAFREWSGPSGSLLHEEVFKRSGGSLGGRYYFSSADPTIKDAKDYPGLVQKLDLPGDIGADSAALFCGNIGKSAKGTLDDCQIWGYWARYGQYIVDLEVTGLQLTQRDFTTIAKRWDAATAAALPA
jgi:hypothetical protein